MGELWIVMLVSVALAWCTDHVTYAPPGRIHRQRRWIGVACIIVFLTLFAGLRTESNDTWTYMNSYRQMAAFPEFWSTFRIQLGDNPGFQLVNAAMKTLGWSAQSFVLFYTALTTGAMVWLIRRYSERFVLSIFLYICANGYLFSFGAIKQCAAIAIGSLAIPYMLRRRWAPFLLLVFLASTFHPYILLFLLLPFLTFRPWTVRTYWMLLLFLVAGFVLEHLLGVIVDITDLIGDKYDKAIFIGEGVNLFRVLVAAVPLGLSFVFRRELFRDSSRAENLFVNASMLYACIMFVGLFGTANYFGRLASYFILFPAVALPWMLNRLPPRTKRLLIPAMVGCYLGYFYYGNGINQVFEQNFQRITLLQYLRQIL